MRYVAVAGQALTILITRDLWQVRDDPPLLPLVDVPQIDTSALLLISLIVVCIRPRRGAIAHVAILVYAFVADQTRIQPEVISLAILIVGTAGWPWSIPLARAHLVTLWLWSGLNKVLSTDFVEGDGRWMYDGLPLVGDAPLRDHFGWLVAGLEIAVGIAVLLPATRRLGVLLAVVVHAGILLVLSPLGHGWNESVWPWNAALPVAAFAFFWDNRENWFESARWRRAGRASTALVGVVGALPLTFHVGLTDAYLGHHLYTDDTAQAEICLRGGVVCDDGTRFDRTWDELEVPLPPEPRLFEAYFDETCRAGELLVIHPRRTRVLVGLNTDEERHDCV